MKKNSNSLIRWKFVIPTTLIIAGIVVFFVIFFDPLLAKGIEFVGGQVNGAKVEVDGLSTKFFRGRMSIQRLQVANKANTWTNIVEAGPLAFELDPSELFTKRVIIPEASLDGLKFNTRRKTDGKLLIQPPSKDDKPSAAARLAEKYKDRFSLNLEGMKSDAKAKVEFDPKALSLTKQSDALKAKVEGLPKEWESKVDNLKVEERLKKIEADLKTIENTPTKGPEAITAIPEGLKKLKQVRADLDSVKSDLKNTKENFSSDVKGVRGGINGLKEAKKNDMDDLLSRFNLDFADPKRLIEGMIGDSIREKVQTALHYVEVVRANMPSKKEKEKHPPRPRFKGINIPFPTPAAPPKFWLQKASLSGEYSGIVAAGSMVHLTSDPSRVGQPFKAELTGQKAANPFSAQVIADHVGNVAKDSLRIRVGNLALTDFLKGGTLGDSLTAGFGDFNFALSVVEGAPLDGTLQLDMRGLKLDQAAWLKKLNVEPASTKKEDALKAQFLTNVARGFESMGTFSVTAGIGGTWADPTISLRSNAVDMVGRVVKESVGSLVEGQRKELEAKLDGILKERTAELNQKSAGLENQVNNLFAGLDKQVQDKINRATGVNLGGEKGGSGLPVKVPSLDKLFKKKS